MYPQPRNKDFHVRDAIWHNQVILKNNSQIFRSYISEMNVTIKWKAVNKDD